MIKVFLISTFLILINTIGQICLKQATLAKTKKIIYLILGYSLFVMAIIVSFYLMKIIELKYFTVIMSLIYLTVLLASTYIFKESLDKNKIIGTIVVMVGIIIFIGG
ncbi:EamA family transporter [Arcobacter sp.]|uniref:EamA family transporter n=1 Tax=unclassified Arcobacter TaxID=2593671 RepID=UPI003AFF7C0A